MDPISPEPVEPPDSSLMETEMASTPNTTATKRRAVDKDRDASGGKKTIIDKESASASIQTTYTHPSVTILGIKSYLPTDCGPFIVHVSVIDPDPAAGTTIRPIKFGQFLFVNKIENICQDGVKKVGRNKIAVQFKSALGANKFLNNPMLKLYKYEAFIPTYNVTRMGLVRGVPVDWSMDEFVESVQIPGHCTHILKARRLNRKVKVDGNVNWEPTQTVVLTFRGQELPDRVFSFYSSLSVEPYQFPTIQCLNCCRFGHIKAQCRSKPICFRCAQPHNGEECNVPETESTCMYCSAHHFSTSRSCPEQDRQKTIKMCMSRDGISFQEASTLCPKMNRPYNEVVKETSVDTRRNTSTPSSSDHPLHTQSYKKTEIRSPRPRAPLGKTYDRAAHQAIIANEPTSFPNGHTIQSSATQSSSLPSDEPQDQLLVQLLTIIISIISQKSLNLPSNVAHMISQLSSLIGHNGSVPNNSVELPKSSSKDT